jgi:hypothetical protein
LYRAVAPPGTNAIICTGGKNTQYKYKIRPGTNAQFFSSERMSKSNSNGFPSQVAIVSFFLQKQKKTSPTVPHLKLSFIPSWEKPTLRAHICAQRSAAHPPVLEEVEGYKNDFVFSQDF